MEQPDYPFEEFRKHFDELHLAGQMRKGSFEGNVIAVYEYMQERYTDGNEARYKAQRFSLIMHYLSQQIDAFDQADFAVCGSPRVGALVGEHLLRAVHQLFTTKDLGELGHGPSPEEVMKLARELKRT